MRYRLSKAADAHLENILIQGALAFGKSQAIKYQQSLHSTFEALAAMPYMARASERHIPNERRFVHTPYIVYYTVTEDEIVIQAVLHSGSVKDAWGNG